MSNGYGSASPSKITWLWSSRPFICPNSYAFEGYVPPGTRQIVAIWGEVIDQLEDPIEVEYYAPTDLERKLVERFLPGDDPDQPSWNLIRGMIGGDREDSLNWTPGEILGKLSRVMNEPAAVQRADNGADNRNTSHPQSDDVSLLIHYINSMKPANGRQLETARDFCRKNGIPVEKANHLLRQARRFKPLWKIA